MNAEQLHTIANLVIMDVSDSNILDRFANFVSHLDQLSSNPGDVGAQNNVTSSQNELMNSLGILDRKAWPAGVQQTVKELGGGLLVEVELKETE